LIELRLDKKVKGRHGWQFSLHSRQVFNVLGVAYLHRSPRNTERQAGTKFSDSMQMINFMKNLAMTGGLLCLSNMALENRVWTWLQRDPGPILDEHENLSEKMRGA
jgi:hypothetical protein